MNPNKEFLKNKANALPEKPGVYLMKDQHNEVLYVGKAKSLKQRVVSYFRKNQQHANKVLRLVYNVVDFETIETDTELDALLLECRLIQAFHPIYNRQMNHSANYCFVDLTNHTFTITQTPQIGSYGPFGQTKKLPALFQVLSETFQLPTVNELTLLTLRKQLPQMDAYPLEQKWREIGCFFAGKKTDCFSLLKKRLAYLIDHLLFEQASVLQRQIHLAQSFYQEIVRVNQFIQEPEVIFSILLDLEEPGSQTTQIKYYQVSFGKLIQTKVLSPEETFQPLPPASAALPLAPEDLDPLGIILNHLYRQEKAADK